MFEDCGDPAQLSDETLISALTAATRAEARSAAWRLALVGEVAARQCDDEDDGSAHQVIDGWAWAKAQVGAACKVNSFAASKQMRIATALRNRLPRTVAVFAAGAVSAAVIDAITWRTRLVQDADALVLIDTAIAGEVGDYGTKSETGLVDAVDLWVEKFDPDAVVRAKSAAKDTYVEFDDKDDPHGVASFWGRLRVTDKTALQQRLDELAATVCGNDPRSVRERRAAALGALGVVGPQLDRLTCMCGDPDCAGSGKDPRSTVVVIHVLAEQVPVVAPAGESEFEPKREPAACRAPVGPGFMLDGGVIPAAKLTAFVRMRYLTCTFPGCDKAAHKCDLDHVIPWPAGATHPGNLHPLCREHHLLKTFCGWEPVLASDGTVTWTSPTGHTYAKVPGASMLFAGSQIRTTIPAARLITPNTGRNRSLMMPRRRRTRAQDNAQRVTAERTSNAAERGRAGADDEANPPPY